MNLLLATHNAKKCAELQRIALAFGLQVCLDPALPDVEETGTTFAENALLKAQAGMAFSGLPCVGDDSGLCVDALDGAPGIFSARFAGAHGNDAANLQLLLDQLLPVPPAQRRAHYVCAACCVMPDGTVLAAEAKCQGRIALVPCGDAGFGYDPVFLPDAVPGRTMAQLTATQKDAISHRGLALRALLAKISGLV